MAFGRKPLDQASYTRLDNSPSVTTAIPMMTTVITLAQIATLFKNAIDHLRASAAIVRSGKSAKRLKCVRVAPSPAEQ
jgi:hypothetical protein